MQEGCRAGHPHMQGYRWNSSWCPKVLRVTSEAPASHPLCAHTHLADRPIPTNFPVMLFKTSLVALLAGSEAYTIGSAMRAPVASRTSDVNMAVGLLYSTTTGAWHSDCVMRSVWR